jgi:hypothetical protein
MWLICLRTMRSGSCEKLWARRSLASLEGMQNRLRIAVLSLLLAATAARADGVFQATITVALPAILPPVVVVSPGVQVVQDLDEEVFVVDGWYWMRRGDVWYRARDHRHVWMYVPSRFVPLGLQRVPPGYYRRFHQAEWKAAKEEEKERRRAWREEEKERRREVKEWKKEDKGGRHHERDDD